MGEEAVGGGGYMGGVGGCGTGCGGARCCVRWCICLYQLGRSLASGGYTYT